MADPVVVPCPADVWTKVATSVTTGRIIKKINNVEYFGTYRLTGGSAPSSAGDGYRLDNEVTEINQKTTQPADIYIYCHGGAGSVEVWT